MIVQHHDLLGGGQGRFFDNTPVDAATIRRLACDAGIHRIITDGALSLPPLDGHLV